MERPIIAIGLDAASPSVVEAWMSQGHLKNIRALRDQGGYARLKTFDYYRAETPWTTFLTGCSPKQTGYWAPIKYYGDTYSAKLVNAYSYAEYKPFYALDTEKRVAIVDVPHVRLCEDVNGVQVLAWGAHSPQAPSCSKPSSLLQELTDKHGEHPVLRKDGADTLDIEALSQLKENLKVGIARRAEICKDVLQREPWNLFLTVFGETHAAGHYFWHLSQPEHPLYASFASKFSHDPMLEVFEAIDEAIGDIVENAPPEAQVIVFAAHGMGANVMDLPSLLYLSEFLYRFNFPGKVGIAPGKVGENPGAIMADQETRWVRKVWNLKHEPNPIKRFLRKNRQFLKKNMPRRISKALESYLDSPKGSDLVSPFWLKSQGVDEPFQPATWYSNLWPKMKAFALPSFSEGYIRINLKGRDAQGIVLPSEYNALCDEIIEELHQLKDARTGQPMVKDVVRTREFALDSNPKLPDADLVVIWQEESVTDVVDSPSFGRIGPVPFLRTGSHRSDGFFIVKGDGIEPSSDLDPGHSLDLAPTFMNLMGSPIPDYFEGKTLLQIKAPIS